MRACLPRAGQVSVPGCCGVDASRVLLRQMHLCRACRWPFGPVGLITPFNFPLEIPALQLMGALYMGNKPILHVDRRWAPPPTAILLPLLHEGLKEM